MTQQNSGLVEETASASEEIANQAQELLSIMERFKIREVKKTEAEKNGKHTIHLSAAHSSSTASPVQPSLRKTVVNKEPVKKNVGGRIEKIMSDDGFELF